MLGTTGKIQSPKKRFKKKSVVRKRKLTALMNEEGVCQTTPNALEENTLNIVTQDLTHLNDDEN